MAFQAAANATQRVGNYAPGSLAAQPRRFAGGVRKRGESPDQMANRMDAGYMASAMQGGTSAPTRADNIAKARADGTFDAKRKAFNAANQGSFMDAAGNIGPKAEMPAPPASAPPSPAPPSAPPAPNPTATAPAKPKGPAMFDGRPKAKFFADAASRGVASMPSGVYNQPDIAAKIKTREAAMDNLADNGGKPMPAQKPVPAPAAKPAGMAAAATSAKPYSGPMARPPGKVDSKPTAPPTVTPTPKPTGIVAAASTKAPANGFSPEFHRRFDPTPSAGRSMFSAVMQPVSRAVTQAGAEAANLGRLEKEAANAKKARRGLLANASEAVSNTVGTVMDKGVNAVMTGTIAAGKVAKAVPGKVAQVYKEVKTGLLGSDEPSEAEKRLAQARKKALFMPAASN